jgi:hypothetical protein
MIGAFLLNGGEENRAIRCRNGKPFSALTVFYAPRFFFAPAQTPDADFEPSEVYASRQNETPRYQSRQVRLAVLAAIQTRRAPKRHRRPFSPLRLAPPINEKKPHRVSNGAKIQDD